MSHVTLDTNDTVTPETHAHSAHSKHCVECASVCNAGHAQRVLCVCVKRVPCVSQDTRNECLQCRTRAQRVSAMQDTRATSVCNAGHARNECLQCRTRATSRVCNAGHAQRVVLRTTRCACPVSAMQDTRAASVCNAGHAQRVVLCA